MVAIYSDIRYENATVKITPLTIPNITSTTSYTTAGLEIVGCIDCIDAGNTDTISALSPDYILKNRTL